MNITNFVNFLRQIQLPKQKSDSFLHLLTKSCRFERLQNLDLSSNDIYKLEPAVRALAGLKSLRSFLLEGNPCAVVLLYRDIVLHYMPFLQYLDNVEVLNTDHDKQEPSDDGDKHSQILFKCHRIMGLPKPPKDNKSLQTIHVEVEFPLMEEAHFSLVEIPVVDKKPNKGSKKWDKSDKDAKSKHSTIAKSSGSLKKLSPYARPDEYSESDEENNFYFKTERMPWNKVIEFPPAFIESPERDLVNVRDTFRSVVNVRVVYLKVGKPSKKKKDGKKGKRSKDNKYTRDTVMAKSEEEIPPKETILKKVTLYSFSCHLRDVNWSEETVDFYWADHNTFNSEALRVDGCLKAIKYADKGEKKKKKPKKGKKDNKSSMSASSVDANVVNPLPKMFTCQVGFGLTRNLFME